MERRRLAAAIQHAMREVINAQGLLALGADADGAARTLDTWMAILDSRITRLHSFELRHRSLEIAGSYPVLETPRIRDSR